MKTLSLFLLTAMFTLPAVAQSARPQPTPTQDATIAVDTARTTASDLTRVTTGSPYKAALEVMADNGERVDLSSARTLLSRETPGQREIVFNIVGSGDQPPEFSRLVYLERPGESPLVYFDGPTVTERVGSATPPKTESETAKLAGCLFKPWGPWQVLRTFCGYRYWCFFKKQQAIFLEETRKRQCPNGVQVQTRTVLVHCGC